MSNHVVVDVVSWAWMKADQHLQKYVQMLLRMLFDLMLTVDVFAPAEVCAGAPFYHMVHL